MINTDDLVFEYIRRDNNGDVADIETALDHVDLHIEPGEFIAVLGHNGSGKSTLARHLNGLLLPTEGTVYVDGKDTKDVEKLLEIRSELGMVFQNPDNQIIGNVVDEDVAFAPENMGVKSATIRKRVADALKAVSMYSYRKSSPNKLSGGQKQRVAIAGIMAMEPKCIVLDEPTAMLDPGGREDVIRTIRTLNKEKNITIVLITHNMEETIGADRIFVMDHGFVYMRGTPRQIFARTKELIDIGLEVPMVTKVAYELQNEGFAMDNIPLNIEEFCNEFVGMLSGERFHLQVDNDLSKLNPIPCTKQTSLEEASLVLDQVSCVYNKGLADEKYALKNVNLNIKKGEFIGIVGHTGSGKSTLIQHLNGLLMPTNGHVYFEGKDIAEKGYSKKYLRSKVGMTFQYPEHQLFEETVYKDVSFGPKNLGWGDLKAEKSAYEAIRLVGLGEEVYDMSPFQLSGGQKRRVAIAGILAMNPDYIVLDEPTAGLDPKGRKEILNQIHKFYLEKGITVILVSHSMEEIANYVDRLIVVNDGEICFDGAKEEVFTHVTELEQMGLKAPESVYIIKALRKLGLKVPYGALTEKHLIQSLVEFCKGQER